LRDSSGGTDWFSLWPVFCGVAAQSLESCGRRSLRNLRRLRFRFQDAPRSRCSVRKISAGHYLQLQIMNSLCVHSLSPTAEETGTRPTCNGYCKVALPPELERRTKKTQRHEKSPEPFLAVNRAYGRTQMKSRARLPFFRVGSFLFRNKGWRPFGLVEERSICHRRKHRTCQAPYSACQADTHASARLADFFRAVEREVPLMLDPQKEYEAGRNH